MRQRYLTLVKHLSREQFSIYKYMMNNKNIFRQWVPEDVEHFIQQHVSQYQEMSFDELESKAFALVNSHEQLMDQQNVVLYAGTNVINLKC